MTKLRTGAFAAALLIYATSALFADTVHIDDNYVGSRASSNRYRYADVIGDGFDVQGMDVSYNQKNGDMAVSIESDYFDGNVGLYGTELGDFFISTDGWNPQGRAPYYSDNKNNGEDWEYALVFDNHKALSGNISLFKINRFNIISSDQVPAIINNGITHRKHQEVQVGWLWDSAFAIGTWEIDGNVLSLGINTSDVFASVTNFGFHWTQTCGNDVIEGGMSVNMQAVPEPSTVALGILGLIALAGAVRLRRRAA